MSLGKCRAIVIRTVDYSESSVVLKCFTDLHGMQSYMVNGVRSKKGSIRPSQLMPLTLLELDAYHQQNKNLQRIKELKCSPQLRQLHFDMIKSAIGMFMTEVVNRCIREENHPDPHLFEYLYHAVQFLDLETESCANFPLVFITQLSRYMGFYPRGSYTPETNGFDLKDGEFTAYHSGNPFQLSPSLSLHLSDILQCSFHNSHALPVPAAQRALLLDAVIAYYQEHMIGFQELKSHKLLSEILR